MTGCVTKSSASSYGVRNRGEWARIFIEQGRQPSGNTWGQISVVSSFGNFGHGFSNAGPNDFKEFLVGVGFDYLMGKFLGTELREFDLEATIRHLKEHIGEWQQDEIIEASSAERLAEAFLELEEEGAASADAFLISLSHKCPEEFGDLELWGYTYTRYSPQAVGFWERIWPIFCDALRTEIGSRTAA